MPVYDCRIQVKKNNPFIITASRKKYLNNKDYFKNWATDETEILEAEHDGCLQVDWFVNRKSVVPEIDEEEEAEYAAPAAFQEADDKPAPAPKPAPKVEVVRTAPVAKAKPRAPQSKPSSSGKRKR